MLETIKNFFTGMSGSMQQPTPPPPTVFRLECDRPRPGWVPRYGSILVIDDMPRYTQAALETLRIFYEEANLTVHLAHTFRDGLATFEQHDIPLVILDLDLNDPQGSGAELMAAFRAKNPEVVILANSSEQKYNDILLQGGAVAALAKEARRLRRWLRDNGWQRTGGAGQTLANP